MDKSNRVESWGGPTPNYRRHATAARSARSPEALARAEALTAEIDFARRLRDYRDVLGLSQRQVAEITGEDQSEISRLERGARNPSVERMNRILARLRENLDSTVTELSEPASPKPMTSAKKAAAYLCAIRKSSDRFSNMKLQKLLYYAQGYAAIGFGRPLFGARIEAWEYGPVVRSVYATYADHGSATIPRPSDVDLEEFDPEIRAVLDHIYAHLGSLSASQLMSKTHADEPWTSVRHPEDQTKEIPLGLMKSYFTEHPEKLGLAARG